MDCAMRGRLAHGMAGFYLHALSRQSSARTTGVLFFCFSQDLKNVKVRSLRFFICWARPMAGVGRRLQPLATTCNAPANRYIQAIRHGYLITVG
jgi:hypothetical protein